MKFQTAINRQLILWSLLPFLFLASTCGKVSSSGELLQISSGGLDRSFMLHSPQNLESKKSPLVIALHGNGMTASSIRTLLEIDPIADREGFRVIYPQGLEKSWNVENSPTYSGAIVEADDLGFLSDLIDHAVANFNVDPKAVYITGFSRGGSMAYAMAWLRGDKVAAVAPIASSIHVQLRGDFAYDGPVSTMAINGSEDPFIPIDGGAGRAANETKSNANIGNGFMGVKEVIERVADENGCYLATDMVEITDTDPTDGCTATQLNYTTCPDRGETILVLVNGGGHSVPGKKQYQPEKSIGRVCKDFDAMEMVWEFFKRSKK